MQFHDADTLVTRLHAASAGRKVVFLVGSALTMPQQRGRPGVASVSAMVELVRERLAAGQRKKLDEVLRNQPTNPYQCAFDQLKGAAGADALNEVVRKGVLQARRPAATPIDAKDLEACQAAEDSEADWHLGSGVRALGVLLADHPSRFARTVLTTNFDPLVEVAVQTAGGKAHRLDFRGDAGLGVEDPSVRVVHLHGSWRGDTWHSVDALTQDRAQLVRSLAGLFEQGTLVVLGYGGWDDVITAAIDELGKRPDARPDVIWCFYERDPEVIKSKYANVLARLAKLRERASCFAGIDCNEVLPALRARMDGECEVLGRRSVCDQLGAAIEGTRAVEILGEPMMGRTRLLEWVARQGREKDKPVALIHADEVAGSPVTLVRKIGEALGRSEAVERALRRERANPSDVDASRALEQLRGAWLLLDDADLLAQPGNRFTEPFFGALREEVQNRRLLWVSVSHTPLGPLFAARNLVSKFLNDATRIHAGALAARETALALRAHHGKLRGAEVGPLVGTLPLLVDRVCDPDGRDAQLAELGNWAATTFDAWWQRDEHEQALLRRAAAGGLRHDVLSEQERTSARYLCLRGLMVETEQGYALNGAAWRDHVASK